MIIREKGLLDGKRLRKCSSRARLFWPWLYALSNGYVRLELDFELLSERLVSFKEDAPTAEELEKWFRDDYAKNNLIFIYETNGQLWGQWDTAAKDTKDYKTAGDKESPPPPEEDYLRWLCERHGEDWLDFHWNQRELAKGLPADFAKLLQNVYKDFAVGVGKGKGFGFGSGQGERTVTSSTSASRSSSVERNDENSKSKSTSKAKPPEVEAEDNDKDDPVKVLLSAPEGYTNGAVIDAMISKYPRKCPEGKYAEWKDVFGENVWYLGQELFRGDCQPAIILINKILNAFVKKSRERGSPAIPGPEKFFATWVYKDFSVLALRKKAEKEAPAQTIAHTSGQQFELDDLEEEPTEESFSGDALEDNSTGRGWECVAEPSSRNGLDNGNPPLKKVDSAPVTVQKSSVQSANSPVEPSSCPSGNEAAASEPALLSPLPYTPPKPQPVVFCPHGRRVGEFCFPCPGTVATDDPVCAHGVRLNAGCFLCE
jgi:hypothetical protein